MAGRVIVILVILIPAALLYPVFMVERVFFDEPDLEMVEGEGEGEVEGEVGRSGVATVPQPPASTQPADAFQPLFDSQDELFQSIITSDGLIRYTLLRTDEALRSKLNELIEGYARTDLPEDAKSHLALFCNAYNLNMIRLVIEEEKLPARVLDMPGFFDKKTIVVAGETMTLNGLEHQRIRALGDPRIHAALNCAAVSCPPMASVAFRPVLIDAQLEGLCRAWVNDQSRNYVENDVQKISQIFEWFRDDFDAKPYGNVRGFLRHFAAPGSAMAEALNEENGKPAKIKYIIYNWTLNNAE